MVGSIMYATKCSCSRVATEDNLADALTKPLSHELLRGFRERIGITSRPSPFQPTAGGHGQPQTTLDATSASTDSRVRESVKA
jgi:hypothetical protein